VTKRHFVEYDKEKLYSLVESLNAGGVLTEIEKMNEHIANSNNFHREMIDSSKYIVDIALRQMEYIEQIDLKEKQGYYNANFSIIQEKLY
jgi:hypothetical protein